MKMDPTELMKDLKNPSEEVKLPRRDSNLLLKFLSIGALVLSLGIIFFLIGMNKEYELRGKNLSDQVAELRGMLSLIGERLDEEHQSISSLNADVELVQQRVGLTQNEIKRARSVAEQLRKEADQLRKEQEKDVLALTNQLLRKADSQEVVTLDKKSEVKFQEIGKQITEVQEKVKTSRNELEKTWKELSAVGLRVSEQGRLIATTGDALEELKQRGERDYLKFDARKKKKLTVGNIVIELRKADRKKHRADLRLYYDDKRVDRKKVYTNTPLVFYVGRNKIQYELVINQVMKNRITGYISVPLGKFPKFGGLRAKTAT